MALLLALGKKVTDWQPTFIKEIPRSVANPHHAHFRILFAQEARRVRTHRAKALDYHGDFAWLG
jgi:hypothetical protein